MTCPTYWGWRANTTVLWVSQCKTFFPPAGHHFFLFHPPHSGNENDGPLERGKNSPLWRVRGPTQRGNCLNEIPVRDEWAAGGLLGSQACAAAGLCPVRSLKATSLFFIVSPKIWKVLDGDFDVEVWFRQIFACGFLIGVFVSLSACLSVFSWLHTLTALPYLSRNFIKTRAWSWCENNLEEVLVREHSCLDFPEINLLLYVR